MNALKKSTHVLIIASVVTALAAAVILYLLMHKKSETIKVGVIYSLTGASAISTKPLVDAVSFAVEEVNSSGGLLGQKVEIILADDKSDNSVITAEAQRLIDEEKVSVLFACWTSSCRKNLKPIIEIKNHLMFYTTQYEGLDESPNIVFMGSTPNQQIFPGTKWALDRFGKKVFLIGSNEVFPYFANFMISELVKGFKGSVLAEVYSPRENHDFESVVNQIKKLKPDFVINTVAGEGSFHFFKSLRKAKLHKQPVLSFRLSESELTEMGPEAYLENHFAVWNYFQSLNIAENKLFVKKFKERFGQNKVTSAPIVNAYNSVHLWAQTVRRIETADPVRVSRSIRHQSMVGPDGMHVLDISTRHMWQKVLIGQAEKSGQFKIVFSSTDPVLPEPFPVYRTKNEWSEIVAKLFQKKSAL